MNEIEKAIEALKCIKNCYSGYENEKYLKLAISALEAQQEKWIPVTESVPIVDNLVLCCVDGAVITGYYHESKWHTGRFNTGTVIAWRPLPEPYDPLAEKIQKVLDREHDRISGKESKG